MDIDIRRLTTLAQAKALARCVFDTYGLTFHRSYLYDPGRTLELNEAGHLTSFLGMRGDEVVAHLAAIRPDYELTDLCSSTWGQRVRELGLAMVRPDHRRLGVQTSLVGLVLEWCRQNGIVGNFSRCVTHHTAAQRLAIEQGATATCVLLGCVPFWVRYEGEASPDELRPISTLVFYRSFRPTGPDEVFLPEPDSALFQALYRAMPDVRLLREAREGVPEDGPSEIRVLFDPAKQVGRVHVLRAGADLEQEVLARYEWLAAGRIRHVTVLSPLSTPLTARAVPVWKDRGMIFGGVLPCLTGCDMAVYQGIFQEKVSSDAFQVTDPLSRALRDAAIRDWSRAGTLPRPDPASCRGYFPPSTCL
jgi:hypothetical protein